MASNKFSARRNLRRTAFALWSTPLILLLPIWYGAIYDPGLIADHLGFFAAFFGLPFIGAAIFYYMASKASAD